MLTQQQRDELFPQARGSMNDIELAHALAAITCRLIDEGKINHGIQANSPEMRKALALTIDTFIVERTQQ